MYEKYATFLRLEALRNNLKDFGLRKSLDNLPAIRKTLAAVTDRLASFEAEALNVHVDFPLFQRMALPIVMGHTKVPGIKIHDTRVIRLMEVLLHAGTKIDGWRTPDIRQRSSLPSLFSQLPTRSTKCATTCASSKLTA